MPLEQVGLRYVLDGSDEAIKDLKEIAKQEKAVGEEAKDAATHTQSLGKTAAASAIGFGAAELGLKALKGAFAFGIGNAIEFEHKIDAVGAVSGASAREMEQLSATAKQLGADTAFSAGQAADAMQELAAGGRSVAQILGGEAKAAVDLAAAGGYGLADSARTIATTMAVWEDQQLDTNDVVNRLAGAANTSRFGVEDMSQAIAQGGGVAASAGVSFQDFSTAIAATASSFSSGSDAGTSFKTFITSLTGSSELAKAAIKQLGLEFYTSSGTLKSMSEVVQELHDKLGPLSKEQQTVALKTIFGNDAFRTAASLMKLTGDEFTAMSTKMKNTSAADVAKQRMNNLSGSLEQLKGSAETLGISFGEKMIPVLTAGADGATKLANAFGALPSATQNLILLLGGIGAALPIVTSALGSLSAALFVAEGAANAEAVAANRAKLATIGIGLAIGGVLIAADALLQHFTGEGLLDHLLGNADENERRKKALADIRDILNGIEDPAARIAALTSELQANVKAWEATSESAGVAKERMGQVSSAVKDAAENNATAETKIRELGKALQDQGLDVFQLKSIYDQLPPTLQKVFDAETHVLGAYEERSKSDAQIYASGLLAEAQREKEASSLETVAVKLEGIKTPLDEFNEGLMKQQAETGKAVDRTKELNNVLDILAGRFSEANPTIIAARGNLAAVDEELEDLNRSGGSWSETLGMTKTQLEGTKKALEDQIAAADANEKATKGMRDELQLYIGDGLLNLDSALRDSKLGYEAQVSVQELVAKGLRALSKDDIPGFIGAMKEVEEAAPGTATVVANALGPELKSKILANVDSVRAAGGAVGDAIVQGLEQHLDSAMNRISEKGFALGHAAVSGVAEGAATHSPSKYTYQVGTDVVKGLEDGITDGTADAEQTAVKAAQSVMNELKKTIAIATKELQAAVESGMEDAISSATNKVNDLKTKLAEAQEHAAFINQVGSGAVPYLGADNQWHLPGSDAPGASTLNIDQNDPKNYKVGKQMGSGTSLVTWDGEKWVQVGYEGQGYHAMSDFSYGISSTQAALQSYDHGTSYVPRDMIAMLHRGEAVIPASVNPAVVAAAAGSDVRGRGETTIAFDFSGAQLTGTPQDNERMLRQVVTDALREVSGRDAFTFGVRN